MNVTKKSIKTDFKVLVKLAVGRPGIFQNGPVAQPISSRKSSYSIAVARLGDTLIAEFYVCKNCQY